VTRHAELAHDKDIERGIEGFGDFESYGNSAAREGENYNVWAVCVLKKLARQ
jgi:hypothetical protein